MRRVATLGSHEWPRRRPFTHPGLASRDCEILIGLISDLARARNEPPQVASPERGRDRLITTDSGRKYKGGPVAIVGFFGERNPAGGEELKNRIDQANSQMVGDFDSQPVLLGYVSRLLDDGFNYANLVVLAGSDGIDRWREIPNHVSAATDLAPSFYNSVRIYNGKLPGGLGDPRSLELHVVKFWDYRGGKVWQGERRLVATN